MEVMIKKTIKEARYWNCDGVGIAIVASITDPVDWAAYIGGDTTKGLEEDTVQYVKMYGCKLSEKDARHFFPDIELPYRH